MKTLNDLIDDHALVAIRYDQNKATLGEVVDSKEKIMEYVKTLNSDTPTN